MSGLVLGPILRYVDGTTATVWVETDRPATVEILEHRARTFTVEGHHYAIVSIGDLEPGTIRTYEIRLDGRRVWPTPDNPPSLIRTPEPDGSVTLLFGSCRAAAPHEPPWTLPRSEDERGREHDALRAYARRLRTRDPEQFPDALLMLGDQVYVDESFPRTRELIRSRRDTSRAPGDEVLDFEEYTSLYRESWSDPDIRWLMSTVSTSMIFDDHDVADDWNISEEWVRDMRLLPWWETRVTSGLMTYWIYQHLGNLMPSDLERDDLFGVVSSQEDGSGPLRAFARDADRGTKATIGQQWSFSRDLGRTRLVVVDSRCGRVLEHGRRQMVDDDEWAWVEREVRGGDYDHLLVGSSLPWLLPRGIHDLEVWSESVCAHAWGRHVTPWAEWLRRAVDLEHWSAFGSSFDRMADVLTNVASGRERAAPTTVAVLSGDVHYSYIARAEPADGEIVTPIHQAVCSPMRNPVQDAVRRLFRLAISPGGEVLGKAFARSIRAPDPSVRWRLAEGPWFDNLIASVTLSRGGARLTYERVVPGTEHELETVHDAPLAGPGRAAARAVDATDS